MVGVSKIHIWLWPAAAIPYSVKGRVVLWSGCFSGLTIGLMEMSVVWLVVTQKVEEGVMAGATCHRRLWQRSITSKSEGGGEGGTTTHHSMCFTYTKWPSPPLLSTLFFRPLKSIWLKEVHPVLFVVVFCQVSLLVDLFLLLVYLLTCPFTWRRKGGERRRRREEVWNGE